jgi:glycogen(starch) synthase
VRVLMLTWYYPPQVVGGIAAHVDGLSRAMARHGHEVVVFAPSRRRRRGRADPDIVGVRVERVPIGLPWLPDDDVVAHAASASHHFVQQLAKLGDWRPDVVHVHDWRLAWAADTITTLTGATLVVTVHATERVRHGGHLPPGMPGTVHSIESWLAFRSDALIATSKFMVREVVTGLEVTVDRVQQIPNGIAPEHWAPVQPSARRSRLVFTWGRVQYEKGFQVLARAISELRGRVDGIECVIGGRGSYLPELQSQIDLEGVSDLVALPGFLNDVQLRTHLHRAGCVVIPSLYEPFGIVALEALAGGAPLIVARTGGLAELVESTRAGLMFEPGNATDLARCIERVLTDADLADELGAHGTAMLAERYSWDAISRYTIAAYVNHPTVS